MKKTILLVVFALSLHAVVNAQTAFKGAGEKTSDDVVFVKAEHAPEFPGGQKAFNKWVESRLDQSVPRNMGAPAGVYQVKVEFIVDQEGNVSKVKGVTNHGYEMEYTAEQLIKKSPRWKPAKQNGHTIKYLNSVTVTFKVD
jgi:protein TonB